MVTGRKLLGSRLPGRMLSRLTPIPRPRRGRGMRVSLGLVGRMPSLPQHVLIFRSLQGHRLFKSAFRLFKKVRRKLDIVQQVEEEVIDRH